jgi:hypothetical protein
MRTKLLVVSVLAVMAAATAGVIATQQASEHHGQGTAAASPVFQLVHAGCSQEQSHVPKHLATVLELTDAQVADMNAIATEACAAMEQIHQRMRNVLTPEQHEKARALHGRGHGHAAASWFRKLHGGQ